MTVQEIAASTRQVADGVKSCESIYQLAHRTGVEMPIVEHVARLIRGEVSVQDMLVSLVSRDPKPERA
jgi:glycerol-3-phosphate dehydrogenase (NAD(P)+)